MKRADLRRAAKAIEDLLDALDIPKNDPELRGTPARVAETLAHDLLSGYGTDPAEVLAEATASRAPGLVVLADVAAVTVCPHHLLPAVGVVHLGYLPGEKVAGLGALARLVDCLSRRLVLQEDLGQQIADALVAHLGARGAGAIVELSPLCVTARGERRHGTRAVTTAYAGALATDASARAELLQAVAIARRPPAP